MVEGEQQGGDGRGQHTAHHHGQRRESALGHPLLGGGGGADGVGAGTHGEPLGLGVGDPHQLEQGVAHQGPQDPHHHHHGGGDGGNAAEGLADAHGERRGDGLGGDGGEQRRIRPHQVADPQGGTDRDEHRGEGAGQDGCELVADLARLLVQRQGQGHHGGFQQGGQGRSPLLVLIQRQIEPEQQADDDGGGDQHRIDDGPGQAAVEGPGHEIEGQGEGQGEPEDHGLFIL